MSSVVIKLFETVSQSRVFHAVIPSFPIKASLSDLRREIHEEDLLDGKYVFVNDGKVCAKDTEGELTVEASSSHADGADENCEDERPINVVEVKFVNDSEEGKNTSDETPTSDESSEELEDTRKSELSSSRGTKREGAWQMFKLPNSLEVKQIKIYTSEEIGQARGMRASYLKFWNKRAKALCTKAPNLSKKTIYDKINDEWRLEQEQILKREAEVLEKSAEAPVSLKAGTLTKNMEAINEATEEMRETTSKLRGKSLSSSQRKELTAFQRRAQTKLKRAQDTMRKNLKVKKSKIDAVMSKAK